MSKVEVLLLQVRHVKTFLEMAEAALAANGSPDANKIDAASTGIESASEAFPDLLRALTEARAS